MTRRREMAQNGNWAALHAERVEECGNDLDDELRLVIGDLATHPHLSSDSRQLLMQFLAAWLDAPGDDQTEARKAWEAACATESYLDLVRHLGACRDALGDSDDTAAARSLLWLAMCYANHITSVRICDIMHPTLRGIEPLIADALDAREGEDD